MDVTDRTQQAYDAAEMQDRAARPLGEERTAHVQEFAGHLRATGARHVLEVGCGAGRDGVLLEQSGSACTGVDLAAAAVRLCRERGLDAVLASATRLPFVDASFDAAWSMSTLMHLPGDGFALAVAELRRVVRSGGRVEIGVWGAPDDRERTLPDGRYFRHRSEATLRRDLAPLGDVVALDTWDWREDGGHYQWVRVVVG
ncbi:hypothetical protein GCM10027446_00040 [Angustibacter peucedani]